MFKLFLSPMHVASLYLVSIIYPPINDKAEEMPDAAVWTKWPILLCLNTKLVISYLKIASVTQATLCQQHGTGDEIRKKNIMMNICVCSDNKLAQSM